MLWQWGDIVPLYTEADREIKTLEQQGKREALMMKGDYGRTEAAWAEYDYEMTNKYLQKTLDKAAELPEPPLLSVFGLVLLSALLRRGSA